MNRDQIMLAGTPRLRDLVPPRNLMKEEQRTEPRTPVADLRATLFHAGRAFSVRLRDRSVGGLQVEGAASLRPGDTVVVSIDGGTPLFATVRWTDEERIGLQLNGAPEA